MFRALGYQLSLDKNRGVPSCSADRAKAIKTTAVVNESPTEKLIRELREENQRLMEQLKKGGVVMVQGEADPQGASGIPEDGKY